MGLVYSITEVDPTIPSKAGNARKILQVTSDETALEFQTPNDTLKTLINLQDDFALRSFINIIGGKTF